METELLKRITDLSHKFQDQLTTKTRDMQQSLVKNEEFHEMERKIYLKIDSGSKALWKDVTEKFVSHLEYDEIQKLVHSLPNKIDAVDKKLQSSQNSMDLNDIKCKKLETDFKQLLLSKNDQYQELKDKISHFVSDLKRLDLKFFKLDEHFNKLTQIQSADPNIQSRADPNIQVDDESKKGALKYVMDHLDEIYERLQKAEVQVETLKHEFSHHEVFDPKFLEGLNQRFKSQVEICLEAVESLKTVKIPALNNGQSQMERNLLDIANSKDNIVIDSFQKKVNEISDSIGKLREQNTLEMAEISSKLDLSEKLHANETEKLRARSNDITQEKSVNYKIFISPLEDKIRNLDRDYQSEKLKILTLSNQHSNLSLKMNEHIQNFTYFQSQTKVHNEKEEINSREWKIGTNKLIEKCQIDLREIKSIIESHNGGINFLNDQFEATRQEILSLKGACGKLESVMNNVNSDFQSLLENQKNTFMQRIKETVDTLDSNAEQFQNRLILEAQKTVERFSRLDENISNLLRNSLHISRSFEEEEETKELARGTSEKPSQSQSRSKEVQESRLSMQEGTQSRLPFSYGTQLRGIPQDSPHSYLNEPTRSRINEEAVLPVRSSIDHSKLQ